LITKRSYEIKNKLNMSGSEGGNKMKKELQTVSMGVFGGEIFSPPLSLLLFKPQRTQRTQRLKKKGCYQWEIPL
jgi:hypothetical protein